MQLLLIINRSGAWLLLFWLLAALSLVPLYLLKGLYVKLGSVVNTKPIYDNETGDVDIDGMIYLNKSQ
jgi:hypothetical protein